MWKWRQCRKIFLDTGMEQVATILNRIELRKWRNEQTTAGEGNKMEQI